MKKRTLVITGFIAVVLMGGASKSIRLTPEAANAASDALATPVLVCGGVYADIPSAPDENCFSTCGGEIPWPFQLSNQTVELADGEKYVLMGRVFFRGGLPRFAVDLERHPWLATTQRKADPSYPLLGSSDFWRKYEDKPIQLRTQAKWLLNSSGQAPFVEVTLSSLSDPAVIREGHSEGVKAGSR